MKKHYILIPILILNIISLLYLSNTQYFIKQIIWFITGYILYFLCTKLNLNKIYKYIKYLYIFCIFLLILVLIIGKEINGSKAWLNLYFISFQPSELTKLILALYLPYLIINNSKTIYIIISILIPSILTFIEPDTGSIIIYIIILISSLKYIKTNKKIILPIIITLIISHIYLYINNKQLLLNIYGPKIFYRIDRLISFKQQNNIQTINSLISIGAHKLLYIPENHNDFIFASIISKYNLFTTILTYVSLISIIIILILKYNKKKKISNIYNYILLNIFIFQIFYNILMNLSLVPIIGIPLPFISYGGSHIIISYIMISLNNNMEEPEELEELENMVEE